MKRILVSFFILSSTFLFAQKTRVGVVNAEWVLRQLPDYVAIRDSAINEQVQAQHTADNLAMTCLQKSKALDSMGTENAEKRQALQNELTKIKSDYDALIDSLKDVITQRDSIRFTPFNRKLVRAYFLAAEKNRCSGTCDSKSIVPGQTSRDIVYVDVSKDVLNEMQHPSAIVSRKRVGYCNYESLLQLMPGYKAAHDSSEAYRTNYNTTLAKMDAEIAHKQKELDSLASQPDHKIRVEQLRELKNNRELFAVLAEEKRTFADSMVFSGLKARLNEALFASAKENNCPTVYDGNTAYSTWTTKEAEFINVNAEVAKELGL